MTEKEVLEKIEEAAREGWTELDLSSKGIKSLPGEIGKLTTLKELNLSENELASLPTELWQLTNLTDLDLGHNQLTSLPAELGQLTNLADLHLNNNQLTSLPAELGQLTNLIRLLLHKNKLTGLPSQIGSLQNLDTLFVDNNQFSSFPEVIETLRGIKFFGVDSKHLTRLLEKVLNFPNLSVLYLDNQELAEVPPEVTDLKMLQRLYLYNNKLASLPAELGRLTNLTDLDLSLNQLTSLPGELGRLTNLTRLHLSSNQLTSLPTELGGLTKLENLTLGGNPLESPPAEVVKQGTAAVLAYLREQLKARRAQWVSKLLLVGEGGVGKTSLLRALRGEEFVEGLETTHGIGVGKLELAHRSEADVAMQLNTWDFGGQQIYHATHQFFLTNRSLFVLVWDARHGWEAGKLYSWLDRIQARAPESPVMIVATHIDERDADLPLEDLRRKYPQMEGHYKVSSKSGAGIKEFKEELAEAAGRLPLMGEEWPASWLDAAEEIRGRQEHYISPKELHKVMAKHKVEGESAKVLSQWLHELGDILYFREDEELSDVVILNPVWVTEAISEVLESEEVIEKDGVLTREHRDGLWADIDENIREHFLRLMERFDLSYRTLENREISLVVERLPLDPPDYEKKWNEAKKKEGCKEISMKFELSSVPAGIPTWFIARSHRFTTHTHWRMGALFADGKEQRHLGLIETDAHERDVRLTVCGPAPQNFFALLRDGLELTLARFAGLRVKRSIPCPGHDGGECSHEFDFSQLEKAVERRNPPLEIQCPEAFADVSVPGLLFGLHWSTEDNVITRIDELEDRVVDGQAEILTELRELRELTQREFLTLFNAAQRLEESHCPNVFAVLPKSKGGWSAKILGEKMELQLYCQAPGEWHPTVEDGRYEIKKPAEWLSTMGPYIVKLAKVIKYAAPVAGAAVGLYAGGITAAMGKEFAEKLPKQIKLMEELAKKIKGERGFVTGEEWVPDKDIRGQAERVEGSALRAVRKLLDEVDAAHDWGGLKKILTPEGHYLWLCEYHAKEYAN